MDSQVPIHQPDLDVSTAEWTDVIFNHGSDMGSIPTQSDINYSVSMSNTATMPPTEYSDIFPVNGPSRQRAMSHNQNRKPGMPASSSTELNKKELMQSHHSSARSANGTSGGPTAATSSSSTRSGKEVQAAAQLASPPTQMSSRLCSALVNPGSPSTPLPNQRTASQSRARSAQSRQSSSGTKWEPVSLARGPASFSSRTHRDRSDSLLSPLQPSSLRVYARSNSADSDLGASTSGCVPTLASPTYSLGSSFVGKVLSDTYAPWTETTKASPSAIAASAVASPRARTPRAGVRSTTHPVPTAALSPPGTATARAPSPSRTLTQDKRGDAGDSVEVLVTPSADSARTLVRSVHKASVTKAPIAVTVASKTISLLPSVSGSSRRQTYPMTRDNLEDSTRTSVPLTCYSRRGMATLTNKEPRSRSPRTPSDAKSDNDCLPRLISAKSTGAAPSTTPAQQPSPVEHMHRFNSYAPRSPVTASLGPQARATPTPATSTTATTTATATASSTRAKTSVLAEPKSNKSRQRASSPELSPLKLVTPSTPMMSPSFAPVSILKKTGTDKTSSAAPRPSSSSPGRRDRTPHTAHGERRKEQRTSQASQASQAPQTPTSATLHSTPRQSPTNQSQGSAGASFVESAKSHESHLAYVAARIEKKLHESQEEAERDSTRRRRRRASEKEIQVRSSADSHDRPPKAHPSSGSVSTTSSVASPTEGVQHPRFEVVTATPLPSVLETVMRLNSANKLTASPTIAPVNGKRRQSAESSSLSTSPRAAAPLSPQDQSVGPASLPRQPNFRLRVPRTPGVEKDSTTL